MASETLKNRAKELGISHSPNISDETLEEKIREKEAELLAAKNESAVTPGNEYQRIYEEAMQLIRVIVSPTDSSLQSWEGDIFGVSNSFISIKKYIPYSNPEGWLIPRMLLNSIKEKQQQIFVTKVNKQTGKSYIEAKMIPRFTVQELPPLTQEELALLKAKQQARSDED